MQSAIPLLLTPGPLTTSTETKRAMLRDWGSRDDEFIGLNRRVCEKLVTLAGGTDTHVAVPMPGSGTLAMEAMLDSFVPRNGKLLIIVNGVYSRRMITMCHYSERPYVVYETCDEAPPDPAEVDGRLAADPSISHVALVDLETTSGILNPFSALAAVVAERKRGLLVDSMSAFGAVPIDAAETPFDALAASPAKCLEGVPGMCFVIARKAALERCEGNARALALDLYDQWRSIESDGRWRFTPPTHVMAAFSSALEQLEAEGGVTGRAARYQRNCRILVDSLRSIGLKTLLPDELQGPVIVTVLAPADPQYSYDRFYSGMRDKGFVISPGKVSSAETFRIACIGQVNETELRASVEAVRQTLLEIGVTQFSDASSPSPALS